MYYRTHNLGELNKSDIDKEVVLSGWVATRRDHGGVIFVDLRDKGGLIDILDSLEKPRKILIHINNTNPILDESSPEYKELISHGIEISYDGMSIEI